MKSTDAAKLAEHLTALGVAAGQNIVVHSSLAAFGVLDGGVAGLLQSCRDLIGPDAILAVPTYRLTAPIHEIFDRPHSPSQNVGAFSEHVRLHEASVRSCNPLHSHSFLGPQAEILAGNQVRPSFGPGSDFELLVQANFRAIYLGCNWQNAGTFVFHAQACANTIPYRSWQELSRHCNLRRSLNEPGEVRDYRFRYYARNVGAPRETRVGIENNLRSAGLLREAKLAYGASMSYDCAMVHVHLTKLFEKDPTFCVSPDHKTV
jgi:aminoglycoside 3-N-acetyltransferase